MTSVSRLRGVIAAVATPLFADFTPDLGKLAMHCRALLDGGCDGINLLGTTGEATSFSVEQRIALMNGVLEAGLPMHRFMVGTGLCALDDSVRLTRAACELGFSGALVLPPFYYPDIGAAGLIAYVDELVTRVDDDRLALYLYHIPQNTGVPWPVQVVAELKSKHPRVVVGLKDSAGDLAYTRTIARDVPDFDVFPSSEGALGKATADGFAGCISATTNLTARHAQIAWSKQGSEDGQSAVKKAGELRAILTQYGIIASVKAALAQVYSDTTWARVALPLVPLSMEIQAKLGAALNACEAEP